MRRIQRNNMVPSALERNGAHLVQEIADIVGFNFTLTPSSGYGSRREDGSWTGMIGEITEGRADMAIGDMREALMNIERKMFNHLFSILELSSEIN